MPRIAPAPYPRIVGLAAALPGAAAHPVADGPSGVYGCAGLTIRVTAGVATLSGVLDKGAGSAAATAGVAGAVGTFDPALAPAAPVAVAPDPVNFSALTLTATPDGELTEFWEDTTVGRSQFTMWKAISGPGAIADMTWTVG
jgi:hypothetical protein